MYVHPSALIRAEAPEAANKHREAGRAWSEVAARLEEYETEHGLVFMAMPREALSRVRACWEAYSDEAFTERSQELVRDLFNGQDGHLHRIDAVLGLRG